MARATLELPSVLARVLGGTHRLEVEGATLRAALEDALRRQPALRVHLFDESGALRRHVLCFLNDTNTRWLDSPDQKLADGDRITILQAVSGG
ncbi:MAG TPA: MoaD/ThiS family protein [Acidobacteriota bacterium]